MSWYSDKEKGRQNSWRITVPDDIVNREAYHAGMNEAADERRRQNKARLDASFGNSSNHSGATAGKSGEGGGFFSLFAILVVLGVLFGKGDNVPTNTPPQIDANTSSTTDRVSPITKPDARLSRGALAMTTADEGLRVRSCPRPTSDCDVQIKLRRGTKVRVLEQQREGWVKIELINERGKTVRGYCDSSYLELDTESQTADGTLITPSGPLNILPPLAK